MTGYVFRLLPPRPSFTTDMTPEERAVMTAHVAYWTDLAARGRVLAFGPVADAERPHGLGIVLAEDLADAERLRDEDPALTGSIGCRTEITPFLRLVTPDGVHDAPRG